MMDQLSPVRQSQAQNQNRINRNFGTARAQWPGKNLDQTLKFFAPEALENPTGTRSP